MDLSKEKDQGLWITAAGMVSALGPDIVTSCSAARAGILRTRELDSAVIDQDTGEPTPLFGHTFVQARRFEGAARHAMLAQRALTDLLEHLPNRRVRSRVAMLIAIPGPYYADQLDAKNKARDSSAEPAPRLEKLAAKLEQHLKSSASLVSFRALRSQQAGFAQALLEARALLERGEVDACIVGGCDSHVEHSTVEMLLNLGLLKTTDDPVGFLPGEAAAFFWAVKPRSTGAVPLAILTPPVIARDPVHRLADAPITGAALSRVLQNVLPRGHTEPCLMFGTLDGSDGGAQEWSLALSRSPDPIRHGVPWYPVESFGEVGAASGAVATAMALRAFVRGYAPARTAVVAQSGHDGVKAAFTVRGVGEGRL